MTNREKTIIESAEKMDIIREMDITRRHFMNDNWEPSNQQLSAEEFKRCWICLAGVYVHLFYSKYLGKYLGKDLPQYLEDMRFLKDKDDEKLFVGWIYFLHNVKKAITYGQECKCIKQIMDVAGIQRNILINFLDF